MYVCMGEGKQLLPRDGEYFIIFCVMKSHLLGLNEIFLQLPNAWLGHKFYLFPPRHRLPTKSPLYEYSSKLQFLLVSSLAEKHFLVRDIDLKLFFFDCGKVAFSISPQLDRYFLIYAKRTYKRGSSKGKCLP